MCHIEVFRVGFLTDMCQLYRFEWLQIYNQLAKRRSEPEYHRFNRLVSRRLICYSDKMAITSGQDAYVQTIMLKQYAPAEKSATTKRRRKQKRDGRLWNQNWRPENTSMFR